MLLLTVIAAVAGGAGFVKIKVPAGALIGSMLSVALLNIITGGHSEFPAYVRFFTQVTTGAFIGAKISKADVHSLKDIIIPVIILSACMLGFGVTSGWLLARYTRLDIVTALFASAPAGIADMTLASTYFNAEAAKVALLQVVRLISVLALTPMLAKLLSKKYLPLSGNGKAAPETVAYKGSLPDVIKTLAVGLACGTAGYLSGFPAGAISFSMIGCATYNIYKGHAYMPLRLRQFVQCFAGAYIGGMITRSQVFEMLMMYEVVIAVILAFYILNFIISLLLVIFCRMDVITALLSSSAGGLTDMALIADELGADRAKVVAMQLIRVIGIVTLYPLLIKILTNAFHL